MSGYTTPPYTKNAQKREDNSTIGWHRDSILLSPLVCTHRSDYKILQNDSNELVSYRYRLFSYIVLSQNLRSKRD